MVHNPTRNQRPVAHVRLFDLLTWLNACQLRHQTIHHVGVILGVMGIAIWQQSEFYQFGIRNIIQAKKVGTRLLDGIPIGFQCIRICIWKKLSAAMSKTLMQIGVELVALITVEVNHVPRLLVNYELFIKPIPVCSLRISIGNVGNGHTLASVLCTNPLRIREIDADGCRRIFVASEHGSTYSAGSNAPHCFFLKACINRGMVFKPLGVLTDCLCPLRSDGIPILHDAFP